MSLPGRIILLLLGFSSLFPEAYAHAQEREGRLSFPEGIEELGFQLPISIAQGKGDPSQFYITDEGRLSSTFTPRASGKPALQSAMTRAPSPARAFLLSALLPGMGQRFLGQDRWVAYLAGEVWAGIQYLERRNEGRDLQARYRDLAWLVARRVSSGPRVDGRFEYYEALTKFNSSGAYDANPNQLGIQPEGDPETFNGSIWVLASQIFFLEDPEAPVEVGSDQYKKALRYYISRAYTPNLTWNWSSNTLHQAEFAGLIRSSDENLRRSTTMVGVILANHILSAVDAFVSGRLEQVGDREPTLNLSLIPSPFRQDTFLLAIRIPSF